MKNHGIIDDDEHGTAADLIADGAAAFSELKITMLGSLVGLRTGFPATDEGIKPVENDVRSHLATITKLLEAGNGESSENVLPANPGNTLDLVAARTEIGSRLAKLIDQRGD